MVLATYVETSGGCPPVTTDSTFFLFDLSGFLSCECACSSDDRGGTTPVVGGSLTFLPW